MSPRRFKPKKFKSIRQLQDSALRSAISFSERDIAKVEEMNSKDPTVLEALNTARALVADWKAYLEQRPIDF